jgi:hypothetical protein
LKLSQTPFGSAVEGVAIHPQAIIQRARDIIEELGEERIGEYGQQYQCELDLLAKHFRDEAALQLLAIGTTSDSRLEEKGDPEILNRAIALAVANWRQ